MNALLEIAIEQVRAPSPERQERIAQVLLDMTAEGEDVHVLTPEEEASFDRALDDAKNRRFATEEEIEAPWAKYSV